MRACVLLLCFSDGNEIPIGSFGLFGSYRGRVWCVVLTLERCGAGDRLVWVGLAVHKSRLSHHESCFITNVSTQQDQR